MQLTGQSHSQQMNQHAEERTQQLSSWPGSPHSCRVQREVVPPFSSQGAACSTSAFLIHPEPTCCGGPVGSAAIKAPGPPVRTTPLGRLRTLVERQDTGTRVNSTRRGGCDLTKAPGMGKDKLQKTQQRKRRQKQGHLGLLELQDAALRRGSHRPECLPSLDFKPSSTTVPITTDYVSKSARW